jgi:hypothetical protein
MIIVLTNLKLWGYLTFSCYLCGQIAKKQGK